MRVFLSSTVAAGAAVLVLTTTTAASAAPATRLKIEPKTSAFVQYDPSIEGTGPLYDAVNEYVQLRNCPPGDYVLFMDLVQDGVSYPVASTALGVGEFRCNATDAVTRVGMGFYGNGLHPGPAQVTLTIYKQANNMPVLAEGSRTVRIPKGPNNLP